MQYSVIDLTSEFLRGMHLSGVDYRRIELGASFGIKMDSIPKKAQLLFVISGSVNLHTNQCKLVLESGDVVFMPQGSTYKLYAGEIKEAVAISSLTSVPICTRVRDVDASWPLDDNERKATIFSGYMDFELGCFQPLIKTMPEIMSAKELKTSWPEIYPLLVAMERESLSCQTGYASILSKLADIIGCLIVRGWLESGTNTTSCFMKTLRDSKVSEAISYMHNKPDTQWSVESLALKVGLSRSVFAKRFKTTTGTTPILYLTELRIRLAMQYMSKKNISVEAVALQLGYTSAAAFTRAFKRITGSSPKATSTK